MERLTINKIKTLIMFLHHHGFKNNGANKYTKNKYVIEFEKECFSVYCHGLFYTSNGFNLFELMGFVAYRMYIDEKFIA